MHRLQLRTPLTAAAITLAMAISSGAHAYGGDDAIRDCESRLRSEYSLNDFRHQKAEQRGWIKGRDDCWKDDDMRGCVAGEYRMRINELKDR